MDHDAPLVFWVSDSGGRKCIHRNGTGLNQKQSEMGYLVECADGRWGFVLGEAPLVMVGSFARAHIALENAALMTVHVKNEP
jgi:hypothetical protein